METELPPMPVRRLHNYLYCTRLFYLQWVENLFVENADTAAGSAVHHRVDQPSHLREQDLAPEERSSLRSIAISSENLGLSGVVDFIENTGQGHTLIEYKKGSSARDQQNQPIPKENDCAQIAAYTLLLREEGIQITNAFVYYAAEKRRIPVPLTESLFSKTLDTLSAAKALATSGTCPPPLRNDPRYLHCSAYSICLLHLPTK